MGQPEKVNAEQYLAGGALFGPIKSSNLTPDASLGTCTMKYNPKVHEELVADAGMADIHPDQDPDTVQGILAKAASRGFAVTLRTV